MSTTSKINFTNSNFLYKVVSLLVFGISIAFAIMQPVFSIPWMFFLAYLGLDYRKELKGSFLWQVEQGLMLAAIVIGLGIFVVLGFILPWTSKPMI